MSFKEMGMESRIKSRAVRKLQCIFRFLWECTNVIIGSIVSWHKFGNAFLSSTFVVTSAVSSR
jgi:hypothetical protein